MGFLTAFFFPLALQLASQCKCVKVFGMELASAAATKGTPPPATCGYQDGGAEEGWGGGGRSLQREVRISWGGGRSGRREGLLHQWPRESRCT